jgi:hypothetical protein
VVKVVRPRDGLLRRLDESEIQLQARRPQTDGRLAARQLHWSTDTVSAL